MADEFQYVQLPDGSYLKLSASLSDAEVERQAQRALAQLSPQTPAKEPFNAPRISLSGVSLDPQVAKDRAQGALNGLKMAGRMVVDALPVAGGAAGAIIGAPLGPAGSIAGAGLGGGLGASTKGLINATVGAATGATPATPKEVMTDVALSAASQAALEAGGQALVKGAEVLAPRLYRGYLKPSLAARNVGKADEIVQTALDEALPITKDTPGRVRSLVSQLKQQVRTITDNSAATGDLTDIADQVRAWGKQKYFRPGASSADYDAVLKVADRIDKASSVVGNAASQPLSVLQDAKEALQESARSGYGVKSGAETTAEKVGASAARSAIEAAEPATGSINARMAKLIDAAKAIERATGRESNQYINYGTKAMVGAAIGGEEYHRTGNPFVAAAMALGTTLALQPGVMSRVAIVADRLGQIPGTTPAMAARAAYLAISQTQEK